LRSIVNGDGGGHGHASKFHLGTSIRTFTAEVAAVSQVSLPPRGLMLARSAIAFALARTNADAVAIAERRWGAQSGSYQYVAKAAVDVVDGAALMQTSAPQEFLAAVQPMTIVGRLQGRVELPLNTRTLAITSGATASWRKANSPKPVSRLSLAGETLSPLKVTSLIVVTKEVVQRGDSRTEARFNADLQRAVIELLDSTFIDPGNGGTADETPASITNGATPIASTGNPGEDVAALIAGFAGDLGNAYFICDPLTATQIALARDASSGFVFPDVGPRGGSLLGIPLLTSRSSPRDSSGGILVLVDAGAIGVGVEGVRVARSEQASLQMNDTPDDPVSATTVQVSLWENGLVGFLVEISANWKLARPGAVAVVTGASYATSATP
jgi:hypothetical protein